MKLGSECIYIVLCQLQFQVKKLFSSSNLNEATVKYEKIINYG